MFGKWEKTGDPGGNLHGQEKNMWNCIHAATGDHALRQELKFDQNVDYSIQYTFLSHFTDLSVLCLGEWGSLLLLMIKVLSVHYKASSMIYNKHSLPVSIC